MDSRIRPRAGLGSRWTAGPSASRDVGVDRSGLESVRISVGPMVRISVRRVVRIRWDECENQCETSCENPVGRSVCNLSRYCVLFELMSLLN